MTTIRVEQYQFIDNLQHIIDPKELGPDYTDRVEDIKNAFLENGWEGDGHIGLIWIPPFVENTDDTWGRYVWHVKQSNNGISFLGYEEYEEDAEDFTNNVIGYIKIELIAYIYYLQYKEGMDDIVVKTKGADFNVYESGTFKVNWEECSSEEFYSILLSQEGPISCNGYEFEYDGSKFMSKGPLPIKE